MFWAES